MSGYYKLISKSDDVAVVSLAGWDCNGVVLHRKRIEEMRKEVEAIQEHVRGEGHQLAQVLWEELGALSLLAEASTSSSIENPASSIAHEQDPL